MNYSKSVFTDTFETLNFFHFRKLGKTKKHVPAFPASTWVSTLFSYDIWRLHPKISYNLLHHLRVKLHQFAINNDTSVFLAKVRKPLRILDFSAFQEVWKSSKQKLDKFHAIFPSDIYLSLHPDISLISTIWLIRYCHSNQININCRA